MRGRNNRAPTPSALSRLRIRVPLCGLPASANALQYPQLVLRHTLKFGLAISQSWKRRSLTTSATVILSCDKALVNGEMQCARTSATLRQSVLRQHVVVEADFVVFRVADVIKQLADNSVEVDSPHGIKVVFAVTPGFDQSRDTQ